MSEQLRLIDIKPQLPTVDPSNPSNAYNAFKVLSPQVISGELGDVTVYNVRTDFQALDKAHKATFVRKTETESAYVKLVPDIENLSKRAGQVLGQEHREQIISNGTIPEVMPFMAGARIALAERRAKRQHEKAQSALRRAHDSRRVQVARRSAEHAVNETDPLAPEDKLRAKTLVEKAMQQRMARLIRRANHHNSSANIVEEMFTYPDGQVDFDRYKENLSIFENLHQRSLHKLHDLRREQSSRVIHGYRIPVVDKRIGLFSFERLAAGGPGSPIKKAAKALEKRDKAVLKAEALRTQARANRATKKHRKLTS